MLLTTSSSWWLWLISLAQVLVSLALVRMRSSLEEDEITLWPSCPLPLCSILVEGKKRALPCTALIARGGAGLPTQALFTQRIRRPCTVFRRNYLGVQQPVPTQSTTQSSASRGKGSFFGILQSTTIDIRSELVVCASQRPCGFANWQSPALYNSFRKRRPFPALQVHRFYRASQYSTPSGVDPNFAEPDHHSNALPATTASSQTIHCEEFTQSDGWQPVGYSKLLLDGFE